MAEHLIVVEGSHDAAFFGRLLAGRGFREVRTLAGVPEFWLPVIPRSFPVRSDLLDRIMPFPEILVNAQTGDSFAIDVAAGDGALLNSLRTALDRYEPRQFASVSIVLDTDWELTEAERFDRFAARLDDWNASGVADDRPGFPLAFPRKPNAIVRGAPHVGIYMLPGGGAQGTLESILLDCAQRRHPDLYERAQSLTTFIGASGHYPSDATPDVIKKMRRPAGQAKAQCGIIGNIFNPGASLSVSLRDAPWFPDDESELPGVSEALAFLDGLLSAGEG